MKQPKYLYALAAIGLVILLTLVLNSNIFQSNLIEINKDAAITLQVDSAYNERGIYILNDKYYIESGAEVQSNGKIVAKNEALWRPAGSKFIPRMSDIPAPFIIKKESNSETVYIIKDSDTLSLELSR